MEKTTLIVALQITAWALTLMGQALITYKRKSGFIVWGGANIAMILLGLLAGLHWSVGMFVTNQLFCIWSYRKWAKEDQRDMRALFLPLKR